MVFVNLDNYSIKNNYKNYSSICLMSDIEELVQKLKTFRDKRDWVRFHHPKDLA